MTDCKNYSDNCGLSKALAMSIAPVIDESIRSASLYFSSSFSPSTRTISVSIKVSMPLVKELLTMPPVRATSVLNAGNSMVAFERVEKFRRLAIDAHDSVRRI